MRGSAGNDIIDGGSGEADTAGTDKLQGFAGADMLTESLGRENTLEGGPGNDTLRARDTVLLTPPDDIVNGRSK